MKLSNFLFILLSSTYIIYSQPSSIYHIDKYMPLIKEKNVALVVNHSSFIYKTHLVDTLIDLNVNIQAIFSPEHGFFGNLNAGEFVDNSSYNDTIDIISLYGKNKKPSIVSLKDIDVVVFDMQDVGVRFYTYISTLHYVMEACAENNIKLIVLDRPNLHVNYVDGPIMTDDYVSFVGLHPVPIVYGMTIGEYASMINGERWISKICDLSIIRMDNYNRDIIYELEINPSPNLPNNRSIYLYPSLCLFEGTNISVGRGTLFPFQHFGAPYLKSDYSFVPIESLASKYPKYQDEICFGTDLRSDQKYNPHYLKTVSKPFQSINLNWIIDSYRECPDKEFFFNSFFDKLAGSDKLRMQILEDTSIQDIKRSWAQDLLDFKVIRKKYLLYN
jgi:uncharacterized protein YbbC (DUF1343 family)